MWLSEHPEKLGLTNVQHVDIEHRFLSGDSADLVFTHNDKYTVVEVETVDPMPGAYQAIKYRALLCAEKDFALDTDKVQAVLVAWDMQKPKMHTQPGLNERGEGYEQVIW